MGGYSPPEPAWEPLLSAASSTRPAWLIPAGMALFSSAMLSGALAFQHFDGLAPCVLCVYQRYPHALVIILGLAAMALAGRAPATARWLTALGGLVLLAGAGIAFFHVGVEHLWWEGTRECGSNAMPDNLEALKAQLMNQPIVRCTDIAWQMFGISMAGYNFLLSTLAGIVFLFLGLRRSAGG